jgi:hypothetical protein
MKRRDREARRIDQAAQAGAAQAGAAQAGRARKALEHLARVNGWSALEAERYRAVEFRKWRKRSRDRWSFDLEALRTYGTDPDALVM